MKKIGGGIIISHMSAKDHNHMMYGSWDMEWNRQFCEEYQTLKGDTDLKQTNSKWKRNSIKIFSLDLAWKSIGTSVNRPFPICFKKKN